MFNHNILERDIERLGKEVKEKRNLPEHKDLSEKELVKQILQPIVKPTAKIDESSVRSTGQGEESFLPDYLKDSPAEIKLQVEKLVDSVFHQGIEKTVKQANQAGPFILDAFHDALTDKLYEELKRRNLV
ncbi:hypothetical protein COS61_00160 [Candidatus Wolfebacteria bacterium CG03_land_8_20_14_0_80_40_12]|uniref:Uncharacterized protein n=1 Tax=Candidatus Wolfebacteria bacterium CG03_land_8_20_14_0_80_40_12 TaxID=1975069 RepID=A0A2M7B6C4_9BACT|nr:MAG: hypothetical protein COS61_00160 [Candidatus Wolfebacteria bacterium CG03_land_8_20_14_0_80_40_12]